MPKQVQDIKQFLEICRRKDAKCTQTFDPSAQLSTNSIAARIQKSVSRLTSAKQTKFKVRCSRFVYTLAIDDSDKADKIRQSLPPCTCPHEFFRSFVLRADGLALKVEETGAQKKKGKK
jgi:hypothetical protein